MSLQYKDIILSIVSTIPYGKVTSYGSIGEIASGMSHQMISGWTVGRILSGLSADEVLKYPRYRVVNKQGYISALKLGEKGVLQVHLLTQEGIQVNQEHVNMYIYGWMKSDQGKIP